MRRLPLAGQVGTSAGGDRIHLEWGVSCRNVRHHGRWRAHQCSFVGPQYHRLLVHTGVESNRCCEGVGMQYLPLLPSTCSLRRENERSPHLLRHQVD